MISGTSRIFKEQNKSILKNGSKGYRKHIHFLSEYNGGFMELNLLHIGSFQREALQRAFSEQTNVAKDSRGTEDNLYEYGPKRRKRFIKFIPK